MNSGFQVWLGDRFETPYRKLFEHRRITESNLHGLDNTRCYTLDMNGNSHASIKLGDEQRRTRVHVLATRRLHCFESMSFNIISRVLSTKNLKVFGDNILNIVWYSWKRKYHKRKYMWHHHRWYIFKNSDLPKSFLKIKC